MPIQPEDFLDAAKELSDRKAISVEEVRLRTLAGRAYYASYLKTREVGRQGLRNPRFKPRHTSLCAKLKTNGDLDCQTVGGLLEGLRLLRHDADYEPGRAIDKMKALLAVARADQLLNLVPRIVNKFPPDVDTY